MGNWGFLGEKDGCFSKPTGFPTPKKKVKLRNFFEFRMLRIDFFGNDDGKLEDVMEIGFPPLCDLQILIE